MRFAGAAYTARPSADDPAGTVFTFAGHTCEVGTGLTSALRLLLEVREVRLEQLRAALGQNMEIEDLELLLCHLLGIGAISIVSP